MLAGTGRRCAFAFTGRSGWGSACTYRSRRGRRRRHAHCRTDDDERVSTLHVWQRERAGTVCVVSRLLRTDWCVGWRAKPCRHRRDDTCTAPLRECRCGRPWDRARRAGGAGGRFIVADTQGNIVADSTGVPGGQATQDQLARGVSITVNGKRVGTLLPIGSGFGQGGLMGQAEQNFQPRQPCGDIRRADR